MSGRAQTTTNAKISTQDNSGSALSRDASAQRGAAANPIASNLTVKEYGDIAEQAIEAHQWKRAEMAYRIALLKAPKHAAYHSQLCVYVLSREQRLAEAEAECREAVRLKPETAVFHGNLACVLGREKKLTEAETERREAVRLQPANLFFHAFLATNLNKQEKWAEAESEARKAVQMDANNATFHNTLGVALRGRSKFAEADSVYA